MTIRVKVTDNTIKLMFDQLPVALKRNLRDAITELTDELLARIRAAEPRRTGRLQIETRRFIDERENFIRGRVVVLGPAGVGHNIAAAALEYGAHKRRFPVSAYTRRSGVAVSTYRRSANIAERRFLRGPAAEFRNRVVERLQTAIDLAIAEVQK